MECRKGLILGEGMNKDISIIMPVYNAENVLPGSVGSIINQSAMSELSLQLIIVDDASSDGTESLCQSLTQQYPDFVEYIRLPENHGPGYARNIGLDHATGKYIGFIDADDGAVQNMYLLLYTEMERTGADFCDAGYYSEKDDNAILFTTDEMCGKLDGSKRRDLIASGGYIWSKLYKRDFLNANGIRFREEYVLEDMDFLAKVYAYAESVSNVKEILYVYRNSDDSLSKTTDYEKYIHSALSAMEGTFRAVEGSPDFDEIRPATDYAILQLYSYGVNLCLSRFRESKGKGASVNMLRKETLKTLKKLRSIRRDFAAGNYENPYVKAKIAAADIDIMKRNDSSPDFLLSLV